MLGYCGINCDNCRAYRGTVNCDLALLEQAAAAFQNGAHPAKDWVCLGCQPAGQPFLARYCAKCQIRRCAAARQVPSCAACADFDACTRLHEFLRTEDEVVARTLGLLRERFCSGNE